MSAKRVIAGVVALLALAFAFWATLMRDTTIVSYGGERYSYELFLPEASLNANEKRPLVVMLHGYGGSGHDLRDTTNMDAIAAQHGFAVAYPQALEDKHGKAHWNANMTLSRRDDAGFLTALAEELVAQHDLDSKSVFVAGASNGGFMVYSLLCRSEGVFAAGASVMGTMSGADWKACEPTSPVPVLHIFGTADDVVSPRGTAADLEGWGGAPAAGDVLWRWAHWNGAVRGEAMPAYSDGQRLSYLRDDGSLASELVTLEGMWHDWPAGYDTRADAAEMVWSFFARVSP